ncbi:MAG: hypothetical protein F6K18_26970 [Okeania sp. SIO2C2]|uniref:hypothetical protein n=1 Tax=Okeania sp. SIO2C2 TaxID=2607787 RepID=UPI0013BE0AB1|nr:hypothetical protein [Okeania sp. SIO2C2]NEP90172.1 hypothetical protein [Okeania sp. SIO2C2]
MVKLGGVNPPLAPPPPNPPLTPPRRGGEVRSQESGEERITKMSVVMTIEDFFYVQLNGFDIKYKPGFSAFLYRYYRT